MAETSDMPDRAALDAWVERATAHFTQDYGIPPIMARILAWLMVCEPQEQSAADLAAATGASRASVSTSMRLLLATGMVQRATRPGDRTAYFRMHEDTWKNVIRRRLEAVAAFRDVARDGIELLGAGTPQAARLESADEAYGWFAGMLEQLPGPRRRVTP